MELAVVALGHSASFDAQAAHVRTKAHGLLT
jgi:hypothetical protein